MLDNKDVIKKADLQLSDLSSGGLLPEAHALQFMRTMIKEGVLLRLATVVPMKSHKQVIDKTSFATRVLRAGTSGEALGINERSKPSLGKVELSAELFKAEVRIDEETLEDNIEREGFADTIMQMMAAAITRDVDEYLIEGDKASTDPDLAKIDGILKSTTSHVVAAGGVNLSKQVMKNCIQALPVQYMRDRRNMAFLTSVNAELDYRDDISDRMTVLGDSKYGESIDTGTKAHGIPVIPIPMWPEDLGGGGDETAVIFTNPANMQVGIWRNIRMRTAADVAAGVLVIVASLRMDFKWAEETAAVKATGVTVGS